MTLAMTGAGKCPDCGTRLTAEPWASGLCLSCLLELGLTAHPAPNISPAAEANLPTVSASLAAIPGQILGNRYRIRSLLGSGGMGEVFRAFDLKLRVDVALKAVRPAMLADARAPTGLREEVRAAREVVSPNVCRVFDLVEFDGRELVSMEYVDGVTLSELLRERSPLGLQEARELASQFLAGLDAIHAAGLVHRDIKPENVMLTRAGRVVVMDFGIARAAANLRAGTIWGTPAYMAPEQTRGDAVDARADVFSAGVVLAEMVAADGVRTREARQAVWRGVHDGPPRVGDTAWAPVLRKAISKLREDRYSTAAALARALEEVTLRTTGDEAKRPYPGLASFTERDAEYFVGRELEIEEMWKKLRRRHLLALIGPSGAGKSSFLRAGLGSTMPPGWRAIFATPGDRPFAALAHALAPELTGDVSAVAKLIDFEQPDVAVEVVGRWRHRHDQAMVVLDQFEELFTQARPEVQERFAQILARFALEADVHVLVSMRDDFLFHCHKHESLTPMFSDLTTIGPPTGAALRRALVQPALKCGYRFEDESVVEEMLVQVAGERGALPLAAFAMARLWDTRDRERGLLTRAAYDEIGGVGGALAQHAEATLERIGQDRLPIVRELFRNLVTAEGTRAAIDRDELLSIFRDTPTAHDAAGEVLDALVDARLLTSYELPSADGEPSGRRRIEVIHESLLTAWPRLERWRTQDHEGAQLRDQFRQAARLWEDRGKPEDLLWTGTSFREYELWRERYAGKLSASEDAFGRAMTARALGSRRRRRLATAAVVVIALGVAIAMGVLWRRSEAARAQALAAARHAESQQLFTLGQAEIDRNPTLALAYSLASLERNDTAHARRLALRALWQGPPAFRLAPNDRSWANTRLRFSNDGTWLAGTNGRDGAVRLWKSDGSAVREIRDAIGRGNFAWGDFGPGGRTFVVTISDSIRIYSLPAGNEIRRIAGAFRWGFVRGESVFTGAFVEPTADGRPRRLIRVFPVPAGAPENNLGVLTYPPGEAGGSNAFDIDRAGQSMFAVHGGSLFEFPLRELQRARPRLVVRGDDPVLAFALSRDGERIHAWHKSGSLQTWARATGALLPGRRVVQTEDQIFESSISDDGRWLASALASETVALLDLKGPAALQPLTLRPGGRPISVAIDPGGAWMAVHDNRAVSIWPIPDRHPQVLRGPTKLLRWVGIDPRSRRILAGSEIAPAVTVWPAPSDLGSAEAAVIDLPVRPIGVQISPRENLLASGSFSGVWLIPQDGRKPEQLPGFMGMVTKPAFDPDGRRLAAGGGTMGELRFRGEAVVRVWDLDTREVRVLEAGDHKPIATVEFMPDGRLLASGPGGVRLWDLGSETSTLLLEGAAVFARPSPDGRYLLILSGELRPGGGTGSASVYDMKEKRSWDLTSHGAEITNVAWHPSGQQVLTGSLDGTVRVGHLTGEEPHLLMGHTGPVWGLEAEPEGRWFVSAGSDGTARIWPMPEGQPFHTLPRGELLDRLRALTNYRIVDDSKSSSGHRLDFEPFRGWNRRPPRW
jgi:WD40 repeat protein